MRNFSKLLGSVLLFAAGMVPLVASAQTQTLRIVTYNIEDDISGASAPRPGLIIPSAGGTTTQGGVLAGIGEEPLGASNNVQPLDILALEETTSNSVTIAPIVNGLNAYYGMPGMYAQSTLQGTQNGGNTGGNGPNGIVYNTQTVQLVASVGVGTPMGATNGEYRQVMRYEFAPAGFTPTAANEFYVYVSHYKSGTGTSNTTARQGEATIIRANSATLPATSRILYVGDYNIGSSTEGAYQTIVGAGINAGVDPFNPTGTSGISYSASTLLDEKTESSTSLHYRDDFLMMTNNIYSDSPGGLQLVSGTYHTFGNNGTTAYETSTNSGGNTALSNVLADGGSFISAAQLRLDLTTAADHLPVVADFMIAVPEPSSIVLLVFGGTLVVLRRARRV